MRLITRTTLCALATVAFAAPAIAASSNYYLHLDDGKGEAAARADGGHKDWIEIQSWSWGATNSAKYGAISGAHRDDGVAAAAEKRQHGWMPSNRPLDRDSAPPDHGSLRVKVKFPWLDCKVGAAFPDATLQNDAGRYALKDVQVTSCAADSVGLDYAKVTVRGWDPKKKE